MIVIIVLIVFLSKISKTHLLANQDLLSDKVDEISIVVFRGDICDGQMAYELVKTLWPGWIVGTTITMMAAEMVQTIHQLEVQSEYCPAASFQHLEYKQLQLVSPKVSETFQVFRALF